ncbi:acyltransferase family protein [Nocardia bovistercoris]|uniref:Acyltransferase family protein n=1 Tax=Nocardia bovistercoris TaxID=2785916 RepID=A0A931N7W5_9NOCA|nr:acyltransferase family protein [Nocardia bovistercoris]MBH0781148.1 acyltransferase family protein [Nocardia bovistercoris]
MAPDAPVPRWITASPVTTEAPPEYRHDLDGLRGIAIALVVGFHVWMGRVSGGVDVFLVLSGFFFTAMLLRRSASADGVGIAATLRRTARRLTPALVVVLAAVVVTTIAVRPFTQWGDISGQTLASALYLQNWFLANAELDYLAPNPSVSPLQHLWSMSVQGQFYLLMLLVVAAWAWLARRVSRRTGRIGLSILLGAAAALSFWYAVDGASRHQPWTYYDSGARAWELLAGALLAIAAPAVRLPNPVRTLLAILGILGVLTCGVLFDGANQFPGAPALYPVLATAALILAGTNAGAERQPWVNRVLATGVCTGLGTVAYAFYLWHWPILIFYLAEYGAPAAGLTDGLVVVGLALALAVLTHRFVESPLRHGAFASSRLAEALRRRMLIPAVCALGAALLGATVGWQASLRVHPATPPVALQVAQYPGAAALVPGVVYAAAPMRPNLFEGWNDSPAPTRDGCITPDREVRSCVYGDLTATRTIAVVGGSHSEHWLPALEVLAADHGIRIVTYLKEACPLTLVDDPAYYHSPFPECREWSVDVIDRLARTKPDWVFTLGTYYRVDGRGDEVPAEFRDVWTALSNRGLNVLAMRDTPRLRRDGVLYRAIDCLGGHGTPQSCGLDRALVLDPVNPAIDATSAYPNVYPLDLSDSLCRPDRCWVAEGNVLIYRDEHHLTASYARSLAPELGRQIGEITNWW